MILVDTSGWAHYLRRGNGALQEALDTGAVLTHRFVIGELACGSLRDPEMFIRRLNQLPRAGAAKHAEVLDRLESARLWALGIGWIDVHVIASALLTGGMLWTADSASEKAAARVGVELFS